MKFKIEDIVRAKNGMARHGQCGEVVKICNTSYGFRYDVKFDDGKTVESWKGSELKLVSTTTEETSKNLPQTPKPLVKFDKYYDDLFKRIVDLKDDIELKKKELEDLERELKIADKIDRIMREV